jgi:hypothetical protein
MKRSELRALIREVIQEWSSGDESLYDKIGKGDYDGAISVLDDVEELMKKTSERANALKTFIKKNKDNPENIKNRRDWPDYVRQIGSGPQTAIDLMKLPKADN